MAPRITIAPFVTEKTSVAPRRLSLVPASPTVRPAPPVQEAKPETVAPLAAGTMALNKSIVSAYKVMGFGILTTILLGLASFIATHLFYYVNHSWISPTVLSSSDPRVVQLRSSLATEAAHRDALLGQVFDLEAKRKDADRIAKTEQAFEAKYKLAARADLADRKKQFVALESAQKEFAGAAGEIVATGASFSGMSKERLRADFDAHLINRDDMLSGSYQLSQIASARVLLHERQAEADAQVSDLRRQVSSLENAAGGEMSADREVSYEILKMTREFDQSELALRKAQDDQESIDKTLEVMKKTIADYDQLLADIQNAPYLMAAKGDVTLALVPYENSDAMKAGAPVYACKVGFVGCKKVGSVGAVVEGEVVGRHPLFNRDMRGRMVRLALEDRAAAENAVLHVGHAPLLF
ncbi:MAG TPA: hypothetical protein VGI39_31850 [Polyangiaceae bacterium]|jgi:hypothetical protein